MQSRQRRVYRSVVRGRASKLLANNGGPKCFVPSQPSSPPVAPCSAPLQLRLAPIGRSISMCPLRASSYLTEVGTTFGSRLPSITSRPPKFVTHLFHDMSRPSLTTKTRAPTRLQSCVLHQNLCMTCTTEDGIATIKAAGNNAKSSNTLVGSMNVTTVGITTANATMAIPIAGIETETRNGSCALPLKPTLPWPWPSRGCYILSVDGTHRRNVEHVPQ